MDQHWITKKQNTTCILFFNGWGMDLNAIGHLECSGFDLCMINNYLSVEPIRDNLSDYKNVTVIAWSLGVWATEQIISRSDITIHKSIAINGTPRPVHDQYGIPCKIFSMTMEGWNETSKVKFNRRMMGENQNISDYERFISSRSSADQKEELQAIFAAQKSNVPQIDWDVALVGRNDLIFPATNQLNWWTGKTKIIETNQPHFPFAGLKHWEQLLML
jgi:biotin synthesis protein BioG